MRELLTDNISLNQQIDVLWGHCALPALPGVLKPRLRKIDSLSSWIYCFLAYVVIRSQEPRTRDMLAYARLLVREAQRHGGRGWLDYDRIFRQQAAIDPSLQWNTLHPSIQAATIVGGLPGSGTFCTLCRGSDHPTSNCTLAYLHGTTDKGPGTFQGTTPFSRARDQFRRPESVLGICLLEQRKLRVPGGLYLSAHLHNLPPVSHGPGLCKDCRELGVQKAPTVPTAAEGRASGTKKIEHDRIYR